MAKTNFVKDVQELIESTIKFYNQPEYWRETVGSSPKYFTHYVENERHFFGLSKYCAFRNLEVSKYVTQMRYETDGGTTQKHISQIVGKVWIPYYKSEEKIKNAFAKWMSNFFPTYMVENASFISLEGATPTKLPKKKKLYAISPDDLRKKLEQQTAIGVMGEIIALKYELNRLKACGVTKPKECIDHVSKRNSAAGFDIWSKSTKSDVRFIEVKASTQTPVSFFITKNEIDTLRELGDDAFLYLVHITNVKEKEGEVIEEIKNPVKVLDDEKSLQAVLYRVNSLK